MSITAWYTYDHQSCKYKSRTSAMVCICVCGMEGGESEISGFFLFFSPPHLPFKMV